VLASFLVVLSSISLVKANNIYNFLIGSPTTEEEEAKYLRNIQIIMIITLSVFLGILLKIK
jgi:hypothetical protein